MFRSDRNGIRSLAQWPRHLDGGPWCSDRNDFDSNCLQKFWWHCDLIMPIGHYWRYWLDHGILCFDRGSSTVVQYICLYDSVSRSSRFYIGSSKIHEPLSKDLSHALSSLSKWYHQVTIDHGPWTILPRPRQ